MRKWIFILLLNFFILNLVHAIPSFSRQTGFTCHKCHSHHNHPSLTPFGRLFKANGFTYVNTEIQKLIEEGNLLSITQNLNPSLIFKLRYFKEKGETGELQFPEEGSLYLAGRVAKNGGFLFELATFGKVEDEKVNFFSSLKVPFVFKLDKKILGVVPYLTDKFGSAFSFEILNTGAVRNIRIVEFKDETSAQQYIGTDTPAEGIGFYLYSDKWFVVYSPWVAKHGKIQVKEFSHYFRAALTPHIKHWDVGAGIQTWLGKTKVEEGHSEEILKTEALALDFQAMGDIKHHPVGVFITYAKAKGDEHSIFSPGEKSKKAMIGLVEVGIKKDLFNVGLAYRDAKDENGEKDDALTFSFKYIPFRNIEIQFDYSKNYRNEDTEDKWVLMFFGAF